MQLVHLFLLSSLTVIASASSRWGAKSRSSAVSTAEWRIRLYDYSIRDTRTSPHQQAELLGNDSINNNKGKVMKVSNKKYLGKERRLSHNDLGYDDDDDTIRGRMGRRGSKRSGSYDDNIFDHGKGYHYGKSSSSYSGSKSSKKSGKGGGKGYWGDYYDDDDDGMGGGVTTPAPTPDPTEAATSMSPTTPPVTTPAPTTPFIETPSPTVRPPRENPTVPPEPVTRPTRAPTTSPPTAGDPARNCVVNSDGLFGAQIGVAEEITFAYELDVFGSPTTEQQISMISAVEEGISNAIIPELFSSCSTTSTQQKEVPVTKEDERQHFHVGSGLFPSTTTTTAGATTTFRSEEDRHRSHPGGGDSFTTKASLEWDDADRRRHIHGRDHRNGARYLQSTRLTGLSSRPKDVAVNVPCSGTPLGFQCFPVSAKLTVYSQSKLDQLTIDTIQSSILRALRDGGLDTLDNRIYRISSRDLDRNPFPIVPDDTPSPTFSPTNRPIQPGPQGEDSDLPLPLWAIIAIAVVGGLLLIVLFVMWCLHRRSQKQYSNTLLNQDTNSSNRPGRPGDRYKPPPSNLNNNAFGRPGSAPTTPTGGKGSDAFNSPNPHPSTEFGRPNPHPSPFMPPNRLGAGQVRQTRPPPPPGVARPSPPKNNIGGSTTPNPGAAKNSFGASAASKPASTANTFGASTVSNPTSQRPNSMRGSGSGSFGDGSKSAEAAAARKAAYGLGPIKSPTGNKGAVVKMPIPTSGELFSGVIAVDGDNPKSLSGSASVGGGPQSFGASNLQKARPLSSANSVGPSVDAELEFETASSGSGTDGSGSGGDSESEESEENISLSSSEQRKAAAKFGDPDNAFGDADNAFGIGMSRSSIADRYSSSSSYEEEVDEEYEIEYVEEDEEDEEAFQSSGADEEFWDDEVVEEMVVDDPDAPILVGGWTTSSGF